MLASWNQPPVYQLWSVFPWQVSHSKTQVGHELHFYCDGSVTFTFFATSASLLNESGRRCIPFVWQVVDLPIVWFRRKPWCKLQDLNDWICQLGFWSWKFTHFGFLRVTADRSEVAWTFALHSSIRVSGHGEDIAYQGTLSRSADAGHYSHYTEESARLPLLEVIFACPGPVLCSYSMGGVFGTEFLLLPTDNERYGCRCSGCKSFLSPW